MPGLGEFCGYCFKNTCFGGHSVFETLSLDTYFQQKNDSHPYWRNLFTIIQSGNKEKKNMQMFFDKTH